MKEHCMINGERCSKCCEVLTIRETKKMRDWCKYIRNNGYPDDWGKGNKVHHLLIKISKRRAKKFNPHLVRIVGNDQSYFKCKNYTGSGCGDYENRPRMCSDYPNYGQKCVTGTGLYRIDCTYYV